MLYTVISLLTSINYLCDFYQGKNELHRWLPLERYNLINQQKNVTVFHFLNISISKNVTKKANCRIILRCDKMHNLSYKKLESCAVPRCNFYTTCLLTDDATDELIVECCKFIGIPRDLRKPTEIYVCVMRFLELDYKKKQK